MTRYESGTRPVPRPTRGRAAFKFSYHRQAEPVRDWRIDDAEIPPYRDRARLPYVTEVESSPTAAAPHAHLELAVRTRRRGGPALGAQPAGRRIARRGRKRPYTERGPMSPAQREEETMSAAVQPNPFPALTPAQRLHIEIYGYVIIQNVLSQKRSTD